MYQCIRILWLLQAKNCNHNDVRPENLLVLDGKIQLIDFQWATHRGEEIPESWPSDSFARGMRPADKKHDDAFAMWRSIDVIMRKTK